MEEAARSPSPLAAADRDGPGACAGRAPRAAGGGRGGDSRAAANFRRWAEPQGKQPAGGRCRTRTAVPTSIGSEHWATVALKMLPWAGKGVLRWQPSFVL